jgi:hypothetical protein
MELCTNPRKVSTKRKRGNYKLLFSREYCNLKGHAVTLIWAAIKKDVDVRLGVIFDSPEE